MGQEMSMTRSEYKCMDFHKSMAAKVTDKELENFKKKYGNTKPLDIGTFVHYTAEQYCSYVLRVKRYKKETDFWIKAKIGYGKRSGFKKTGRYLWKYHLTIESPPSEPDKYKGHWFNKEWIAGEDVRKVDRTYGRDSLYDSGYPNYAKKGEVEIWDLKEL
jgi:hypothetical protein